MRNVKMIKEYQHSTSKNKYFIEVVRTKEEEIRKEFFQDMKRKRKCFQKLKKKPDKNGLLEVLEQKGRHGGEIAEKGKEMAKLGCRKEMLEDIIQLQYTLLQ